VVTGASRIGAVVCRELAGEARRGDAAARPDALSRAQELGDLAEVPDSPATGSWDLHAR
jgi:NAD(P)-dependent dehydrogenase (short-subunit alcohol dehydrogenase family)